MNPDESRELIEPEADSIEMDDALFAKLMDHSDDPVILPRESVVASREAVAIMAPVLAATPVVVVTPTDSRVRRWMENPTLFPRH